MMDTVGDALLRSLNWDHERVQLVQDPETGLQAVIAIHSTVLGPALGGMRIRGYDHGLPEALDDALRLSRAMTLKASSAGLSLGGGKAVVLEDGHENRRRERLVTLAREIERLGGAYITAEDIGSTTGDMDLIGEHTSHVVGRSRHDGVGGDVSPATACTVMGAMRAALDLIDGRDGLAERSVGVIGLGKVGGRLACRLVEAGAHVVGFDAAPETGFGISKAGVEVVDSLDGLLARAFDVISPCAIGGMVDESVASALRCRVVCGAANNPLAGERTAGLLARRGILYVPDFLANCGGLIQADAERRRDAAGGHLENALRSSRSRTRAVLLEARDTERLPSEVAEEHAWARIDAARVSTGSSGVTHEAIR